MSSRDKKREEKELKELRIRAYNLLEIRKLIMKPSKKKCICWLEFLA